MRMFVILLWSATSSMVMADSDHEHDEHERGVDEHEHRGVEDHQHHGVEIAIAPGLIYIPTENEFTFGLHLHVVRPIAESRWGLGVGLERLFDEHGHTTASVVVQLRLLAGWAAIVAVGVSFEDGQARSPSPSVHIETNYEFAIGAFHIGPAIELAVDLRDVHLMLGLHLGVVIG